MDSKFNELYENLMCEADSPPQMKKKLLSVAKKIKNSYVEYNDEEEFIIINIRHKDWKSKTFYGWDEDEAEDAESKFKKAGFDVEATIPPSQVEWLNIHYDVKK